MRDGAAAALSPSSSSACVVMGLAPVLGLSTAPGGGSGAPPSTPPLSAANTEQLEKCLVLQ
jgi:hypothetical protein